jgi:hypothetical protein
VAEEERKKKEEEDRRKAVPGQKIQAWREVARKLEEEKKFDEALQAWNQYLESAQAGEMKDEKDLPVTFTPEHVSEIEGEISNVKRRWSTFVAAEVARIITKSASLCEEARQAAEAGKDDEMKAKFEEARKILKEYPPKWDTLFPDEVNRLVQYKNDVDYRERQIVQLVVQARRKKAERTIEPGAWVELLRDGDDFMANWGGSQSLKFAWNAEEKSMSFDGENGTNAAPVFQNCTQKWLDYELQFEVKSAGGFVLYLRYNQKGKRISLGLPAIAQFTKFTIKIEGVAVFVYEGDKLAAQQVIDVQAGPPIFILLGGGATVFKNMKVKVNKTE